MAAGPEDVLTMQVARFLGFAAPELLFYHVPNGGYRNPREARKLKDMGVRPGVADLAFVLPDGRAAFVELKAGNGRQTDTQKAFQADCDRLGVPYAVCRAVSEVEQTLLTWGVKLRARLSAKANES